MTYDYSKLKELTPAQKEVLNEFAYAVDLRKGAENLYNQTLFRASKAGVSNVQLAYIAGVTETAIRMRKTRRGM